MSLFFTLFINDLINIRHVIRETEVSLQFYSDIRQVSGTDSFMMDASSSVDAISNQPQVTNLKALAATQRFDLDAEAYRENISLIPAQFPLSTFFGSIICKTTLHHPSPAAALEEHGLAYSGIRTATKLVAKRFAWPDKQKDAYQ